MFENGFSWEEFFRCETDLPKDGTPEVWAEHLEKNKKDKLWARRLLALAYWDANDDGDGTGEQINNLAEKFGFRLAYFSNNRKILKEQLKNSYKIELLEQKNINGVFECQYLRTIQKYSGKMLIKFAKAAADAIRVGSWDRVNKDWLNLAFQRVGEKYDVSDSDMDWIADFFMELIEFRRDHNKITAEDIYQDFALPETVSKRLIAELYETDKKNKQQSIYETLPALEISREGVAHFTFEDIGHFPQIKENLNEAVVDFVIKSKKEGEPEYGYSYTYDDKAWTRKKWGNVPEKILLTNCKSIAREVFEDRARQKKNLTLWESNVLPEACKRDHIMFKIGSAKIISPGDRLQSDYKYRVIATKNELPIYLNKETQEGIVQELITDGRFEVTQDVQSIIVGTTNYPVKNDDWFSEKNVKWVTAVNEENGKADVCRFYYPEDVTPVSEDKLLKESNCKVYYSFGDKEECIWENKQWNIPKECRWQKGYIVVKDENDQEVVKRKVSLLGKIDWAEVDNEIYKWGIGDDPEAYDEDDDGKKYTEVKITVDDEVVTCKLRPGDVDVRFEVKGFRFKKPVRRQGVVFAATIGAEQPIPVFAEPDSLNSIVSFNRQVCEIAKDDFEQMQCVLQFEELKKYTLWHENRSKSCEKGISFRFSEVVENDETLNGISSDYYAISIKHSENFEEFYKFHVYDPVKDQVNWVQKEKDLICTISCASCNLATQKYLCFVPAHKQDGEVTEKEMICTKVNKSDTDSKITIELYLKDFFEDTKDFGHGLLCFIATKDSGDKYNVLTGGFFIPTIEDGSQIEYEDDVYGLRNALGRGNRAKDEIVEIMRREDDEFIEYMTKFIHNMLVCMNKLDAFNYLNCFRNTVPGEASGYIFMCDKYFYNLASGDIAGNLQKCKEWENFQGHWDPLMFDYRSFTPVESVLSDEAVYEVINRYVIKESLKPEHVLWLFKKSVHYRPETSDGAVLPKHKKLPGRCLSMSQIFRLINDFLFPKKTDIKNAIDNYIKNLEDQGRIERCKILKKILQSISDNLSVIWNGDDGADVKVRTFIDGRINPNYFKAYWKYVWKPFLIHENNPAEALKAYIRLLNDIFKEQIRKNPFIRYSGFPEEKNFLFAEQESSLSSAKLLNFLKSRGEDLHEWRKNPNFETAQKLRDDLLTLRDIDNKRAIDNKNDNKDGTSSVGLRDIVEHFAYKKFNEEKNRFKNDVFANL